jgi:hypothetical protein
MSLRYVYGIARADDRDRVSSAGIDGIEGGRVRAIVEGPLLAAVSDVDEREYDTEPLNAHVRDLDWLAPRASAHQTVNGRLLDLVGSVLPLSFGAIYRDDERVKAMLKEDASGHATRLDELRGRAEWVITLTRDSDAPLDEEDVRALETEISASAPGRAFLLEKRRSSVVARSLERRDAEAAESALASVSAVAEKTYREPTAQAGSDVVVLRASLLVPRDRDATLTETILRAERALGERGYRLRASGPWPAYRFGGMP